MALELCPQEGNKGQVTNCKLRITISIILQQGKYQGFFFFFSVSRGKLEHVLQPFFILY